MKRKTRKRAAAKKTGRTRRRITARRKRKAARTTRRAKRKVARRPKAKAPLRRKAKKATTASRTKAAPVRRTRPKAAKRAKPAPTKRTAPAKPTRRRVVKPAAPAPARRAGGAAAPPRVREFAATGATDLAGAAAAPLAPPPPGSVAALVPLVEEKLRRRGEQSPDLEIVTALATAAAGYRKGPDADPPFRIPVDVDERVAEGFVDYYWVGDRSAGPERKGERETDARMQVRLNLDQMGPAGTTPTTIATLAAVALGVWRPDLDLLATLKIYANQVAGWYRAGLT